MCPPLFDCLLARCNDVGLLAEELDPQTGRMRGRDQGLQLKLFAMSVRRGKLARFTMHTRPLGRALLSGQSGLSVALQARHRGSDTRPFGVQPCPA
jgi:hypothetical protein